MSEEFDLSLSQNWNGESILVFEISEAVSLEKFFNFFFLLLVALLPLFDTICQFLAVLVAALEADAAVGFWVASVCSSEEALKFVIEALAVVVVVEIASFFCGLSFCLIVCLHFRF